MGNARMKHGNPAGADGERLLELSEEVMRIAGLLAKLASGLGPVRQEYPCANSNEPDVALEVPVERVSWLIAARRKRARYLSPELFAEPAWDILLDLLRAELAGQRISVSSACLAGGVPASTGLRWLKALEQQGLLLRQFDPRDARRIFVALSPNASAALRRYFVEVVGTPRSGAQSESR
jgi:DNA-binding MarR family transcriptional regulator